ncbi:MAG: hypothetical protein ACM3PU_17920 [Gemmatimonadota bacterium]
MLRRNFIATAIVAALAGCATSAVDAYAVGNLADVQVIDRVTGETLAVYQHGGRRYVAGTPGNRYAIAVRNRTGGRLLAVMSVDGVNVVTGETAGWDQNGYVFDPWQRWEIRGWRKSQERVAAFEFTALPNSYAARTSRPENVGVIGLALFREARPVLPAPEMQRRESSEERGAAGEGSPAPSAARPQAGAVAESLERRRDSARLGTGHGRSESSPVSTTSFERAHPTPDEVITIHYDSRDNLIALGVIPSPRAPVPNPFPGNLGFVPDPPR